MANLKNTQNKKEQLKVFVARYKNQKPAVMFFNTKGRVVPMDSVEKVVVSNKACFYAK